MAYWSIYKVTVSRNALGYYSSFPANESNENI